MLREVVGCQNHFVSVSGLSFAYHSRQQMLRNINFCLPQGSVTAIMGESGSGKSTLLRLLSAQRKPQLGSVVVNGHNLHKLKEARLRNFWQDIGFLFQFGALFMDLNVFDNVAFPLRELTDLPEDLIKNLVLMKLQAVGLRGVAQSQVHELSGGMARRVALARATALDPVFLLYDEPFAGLDPISTAVIGNLIRSLNTTLGGTSVFVSHDVARSFEIADYILLLRAGKLIIQGDVQTVRRSEHPYVRQFIEARIDDAFSFHHKAQCSYQESLGL